MTTTETPIGLFEASRNPGRCRGCDAALNWYTTVKGKQIPMNAGAVPRRSENDPATGKVIAFFAASDTHWATCPAREQFSRKPKARA